MLKNIKKKNVVFLMGIAYDKLDCDRLDRKYAE